MPRKAASVFLDIGVFDFTGKHQKRKSKTIMKNIAIRENHLFHKAYQNGKRYVGRSVAVYILRDYAAGRLKKENPQKQFVNRLGLSVSKKIGSAVERNRAKRIMRAAYDALKPRLRTGFLIVISARGAIAQKSSTDIEQELTEAFRKGNLLLSEVPSANQKTESP